MSVGAIGRHVVGFTSTDNPGVAAVNVSAIRNNKGNVSRLWDIVNSDLPTKTQHVRRAGGSGNGPKEATGEDGLMREDPRNNVLPALIPSMASNATCDWKEILRAIEGGPELLFALFSVDLRERPVSTIGNLLMPLDVRDFDWKSFNQWCRGTPSPERLAMLGLESRAPPEGSREEGKDPEVTRESHAEEHVSVTTAATAGITLPAEEDERPSWLSLDDQDHVLVPASPANGNSGQPGVEYPRASTAAAPEGNGATGSDGRVVDGGSIDTEGGSGVGGGLVAGATVAAAATTAVLGGRSRPPHPKGKDPPTTTTSSEQWPVTKRSPARYEQRQQAHQQQQQRQKRPGPLHRFFEALRQKFDARSSGAAPRPQQQQQQQQSRWREPQGQHPHPQARARVVNIPRMPSVH